MDQDANPVLKACEGGDAEKLSELLAEGCEYMFQGVLRSGPMHAAAKGGHLQCVKLLLQAAERDNLAADEIVTKLCNLTFQHETPLSIAAEKGHCEIVELLATLFSKSTTKPDSGCALNKACEKGNIECFHIILKHVPWLIDARERGHTPIEYAAWFGSLQSMKFIIEADADITKGLDCACQLGNYDKVKLLLDNGCSVEGCEDKSPLSAAAESPNENVSLVKLLLSRGANPCELTDFDYMLDDNNDNMKVTPLALAATQGNLEIVKVLADLTGPVTIFCAAFGNSDECLQWLFEEGFDTFTSTYFGFNQETLWNAICWNHDEPNTNISNSLKILLESGTKYNELTSGDFFVRAFTDMDLEVIYLFFAYGFLEMQFDCHNLPRFVKLKEFLNMVLKNVVSSTNLEDEFEEIVKVNADFINTIRLLMKYYPFAKFSTNDGSNSANAFDFHTSMFVPVVPTLVQMCIWNIRCSIIRNQEQLSSLIVKTLKLPPRLEKLIFT